MVIGPTSVVLSNAFHSRYFVTEDDWWVHQPRYLEAALGGVSLAHDFLVPRPVIEISLKANRCLSRNLLVPTHDTDSKTCPPTCQSPHSIERQYVFSFLTALSPNRASTFTCRLGTEPLPQWRTISPDTNPWLRSKLSFQTLSSTHQIALLLSPMTQY